MSRKIWTFLHGQKFAELPTIYLCILLTQTSNFLLNFSLAFLAFVQEEPVVHRLTLRSTVPWPSVCDSIRLALKPSSHTLFAICDGRTYAGSNFTSAF